MGETRPAQESFRDQLRGLHDRLREELPGIDRVAVAVYDRESDLLRTFLHSTAGAAPFAFHEARLADVPSLADLARSGRDRVLADLEAAAPGSSRHTQGLLAAGYRSSYTTPFHQGGLLRGFVFFDSRRPGYFTPAIVRHLAVYSRLVALLVLEALAPANVLRSALEVARELGHLHDAETAAHLERMARYSRLVARKVAANEQRDEEFAEFVHLFAPLHDIGKIAIPEELLLKPERLTEEELAFVRSHVERGLELVDSMARVFGLDQSEHFALLRNIIGHHHECYDGSGYPGGLAGREIPLEARVVAVADVFDALTTERTYKQAWPNEDAFAYLAREAGRRFDADCVRALVAEPGEVEAIQIRFAGARDRLPGFREAYFEDL